MLTSSNGAISTRNLQGETCSTEYRSHDGYANICRTVFPDDDGAASALLCGSFDAPSPLLLDDDTNSTGTSRMSGRAQILSLRSSVAIRGKGSGMPFWSLAEVRTDGLGGDAHEPEATGSWDPEGVSSSSGHNRRRTPRASSFVGWSCRIVRKSVGAGVRG